LFAVVININTKYIKEYLTLKKKNARKIFSRSKNEHD